MIVPENGEPHEYTTSLDSPLKKLKIFYAEIVSVPLTSLKFSLDGRRINDEDTPRALQLEDDDIIEVTQDLACVPEDEHAFLLHLLQENVQGVKDCLSLGFDVNRELCGTGHFPLGLAAEHGYIHLVNILLQHPFININYVNSNGETAVILAARKGYTEIVRMLCEANVDLNIKDANNGDTAAILAARRGDTDVVKILQNYPSLDWNLTNDKGESALSMALKNNHFEVARMTLMRTEDIDHHLRDISRNIIRDFLDRVMEEQQQEILNRTRG